MFPRLNLNSTFPSFALLLTETLQDGHSSVIKCLRSSSRSAFFAIPAVYIVRSAIRQAGPLLSDLPLKSLRWAQTRKTYLIVSVCQSIRVSTQRRSLQAHGWLVTEHKIRHCGRLSALAQSVWCSVTQSWFHLIMVSFEAQVVFLFLYFYPKVSFNAYCLFP